MRKDDLFLEQRQSTPYADDDNRTSRLAYRPPAPEEGDYESAKKPRGRWATLVATAVTALAIILAIMVITSRLAAPSQSTTPTATATAAVATPTTSATSASPAATPSGRASHPRSNTAPFDLTWLPIAIGVSILLGIFRLFIVGKLWSRRRPRKALRVSVTPEIAGQRTAQSPLPAGDNRLLLPSSPHRQPPARHPAPSPTRHPAQAPAQQPSARSLGSMPGIKLPGMPLDLSGASTIWLALDLDAATTPAMHSLILTIANSLGIYFLQIAELAVGLIASGGHPIVLTPRAIHIGTFQEQLQLARPGDAVSLMTQIGTTKRYFDEGHIVMLITAQPAYAWNEWIDKLKRLEVTMHVIQVSGIEPSPPSTSPIMARQEEMSEIIEYPTLTPPPPHP